MNITVFDYGAGNLHSLEKALAQGGHTVRIEPDPRTAIDTDLLVLPGVGAFASAADRLAPGRDAMRDAIARGLPCVGICLGMQLLFEDSEEGLGQGLGVLAGHVARLAARRVPQIGWNELERAAGGDPAGDRAPVEFVYYAHSFVCRPADPGIVTAWTTHESDRFAASVRAGGVLGVQFHPEKSGHAGVRHLHACVDLAVAGAAARTPR